MKQSKATRTCRAKKGILGLLFDRRENLNVLPNSMLHEAYSET